MTVATEAPANPAFREAEARVFARYDLTPSTRHIRLEEPPIALRAVEVGAGEPVLFLHGLTLCTAHWAPLIARLTSLRCVAIDMPGHGESGAADYTGIDLRRWYTAMLTGCLDALGLGSAHLVGHSYGGMFGLWLALDSPERVRSVVSIGTPSVALGAHPDPILRMLALPGIGRLALAMPAPRSVHRRLLAISLGRHAIDGAPPALVEATYLGTRRHGLSRTASTYLREQFRGQRADPQRYVLRDDELRSIRQPVLILWGDRDDRYQPVDEGRRRAALMPNASFEIVPGGHEPWLDDPEQCARPISRSLAHGLGGSRPGAHPVEP
jgi:pimeloyl-ACP methyl ester carboxylesterase